jgi:hypothetical protein
LKKFLYVIVASLTVLGLILAGCVAPAEQQEEEEEFEVLPRQLTESVRIGAEGDAQIARTLTVPPSPLVTLYTEYWEAYNGADNKAEEIRDRFASDLQKQYMILLGQPLSGNLSVELVSTSPFEIEVNATLPDASRYDPDEEVWLVVVGPQVEDLQEAVVDQYLTSLMFMSMFLESLPGEQRFRMDREVRFELPEGASIENEAELSELEWEVDFGGGTTLTGALMLGEERDTVTFVESLIQTESVPTSLVEEETAADVTAAVEGYGAFTIKYSLLSAFLSSIPPMRATQIIPLLDFSVLLGFHSGPHECYPYSFHNGWGEGFLSGCHDLDFDAYLGWGWKSIWEGGGLKWFETYVDVNPSIHAMLWATTTSGIHVDYQKNVWRYEYQLWFCVYCVPVEISFVIEIDAYVNGEINGHVDFLADLDIENRSQLGARWEDGSWEDVYQQMRWPHNELIEINAAVWTDLWAGPVLAFSAYAYNIAGPFALLTPLLRYQTQPWFDIENVGDWSLSVEFELSGGVRLAGWLRDLIPGPDSISTDLYEATHVVAHGSYDLRFP